MRKILFVVILFNIFLLTGCFLFKGTVEGVVVGLQEERDYIVATIKTDKNDYVEARFPLAIGVKGGYDPFYLKGLGLVGKRVRVKLGPNNEVKDCYIIKNGWEMRLQKTW